MKSLLRWYYRSVLRRCEIHGCKLDTEGYTAAGLAWGRWCWECYKEENLESA